MTGFQDDKSKVVQELILDKVLLYRVKRNK